LVHGGLLEHDVVAVDGELRLGGGAIWAGADPVALARAAAALGSGPRSIAPERRDGGAATAAADAWALGALIARWVGGPGPDPVAATRRRHPTLAAELEPLLVDDPTRRRYDLVDFVVAARTALMTPYTDEAQGRPRGRRRKRNTTEESTKVGHASDMHVDAEPTEPTEASGAGAIPEPVAEVRSAPIVAVSMRPGGPASRVFQQPTPAAPTPQLQRPLLREVAYGDAGPPQGRLAPPRDVVEAERRQARRPWLIAVVALLIAGVVVAAVLASR
jgi:hypothetical protein